MLLIYARRLVMFYICAKFHEIILNGVKVIERTRFLYGKLQRGKISQKNVDRVTVINLCMSPNHAYICAKFHEIISNGIKVIE